MDGKTSWSNHSDKRWELNEHFSRCLAFHQQLSAMMNDLRDIEVEYANRLAAITRKQSLNVSSYVDDLRKMTVPLATLPSNVLCFQEMISHFKSVSKHYGVLGATYNSLGEQLDRDTTEAMKIRTDLFNQVKHVEIELATAIKLLNDQKNKAKEDCQKAVKAVAAKRTDEKDCLIKRQVALASKNHYQTSVQSVNSRIHKFTDEELPGLLTSCEEFEAKRIELLQHTFRGIWKTEGEISKLLLAEIEGGFEQLDAVQPEADVGLVASTIKSSAFCTPTQYEVEDFDTEATVVPTKPQKARKHNDKMTGSCSNQSAADTVGESLPDFQVDSRAQIIEDFQQTEENTVTVNRGETVIVTQSDPTGSGWTQVKRVRDGMVGYVPTNYLTHEANGDVYSEGTYDS